MTKAGRKTCISQLWKERVTQICRYKTHTELLTATGGPRRRYERVAIALLASWVPFEQRAGLVMAHLTVQRQRSGR